MLDIFNIFDNGEILNTRSFFWGGFPYKKEEKIFLVHGVSLPIDDNYINGNEKNDISPRKQSDGSCRIDFLNLVGKHRDCIIGIEEVLGNEKLLECYVDPETSEKITKRWIENNDIIIKKLTQKKNNNFFQQKSKDNLSTPLSWSVLSNYCNIESGISYKKFLEGVKLDYEKNEEFRGIVDNLANKHKSKSKHKNNDGGLADAKNYIFHECAGFLVLPNAIREQHKLDKDVKIICTYPDEKFNEAILWQLKKHNSELGYRGYEIKVSPKKIMSKQKKENQPPSVNYTDIVQFVLEQEKKEDEELFSKKIKKLKNFVKTAKLCTEYGDVMSKLGMNNSTNQILFLKLTVWGNNNNSVNTLINTGDPNNGIKNN